MKPIKRIFTSGQNRNNSVCRPGFEISEKSCWRKLAILVFIPAVLSMSSQTQTYAQMMPNNGPVKVQILETNGGYQLYVDHKPFYIKGAGIEFGSQEKLKEHGGNSFRTWSTYNGRDTGQEILD